MGDQYLRCLLVNGMASRARSAKIKPDKADPWLLSLLEHKPAKLAAVARLIWEANKTARIAWVVLTNGEPYRKCTQPHRNTPVCKNVWCDENPGRPEKQKTPGMAEDINSPLSGLEPVSRKPLGLAVQSCINRLDTGLYLTLEILHNKTFAIQELPTQGVRVCKESLRVSVSTPFFCAQLLLEYECFFVPVISRL